MKVRGVGEQSDGEVEFETQKAWQDTAYLEIYVRQLFGVKFAAQT